MVANDLKSSQVWIGQVSNNITSTKFSSKNKVKYEQLTVLRTRIMLKWNDWLNNSWFD